MEKLIDTRDQEGEAWWQPQVAMVITLHLCEVSLAMQFVPALIADLSPL